MTEDEQLDQAVSDALGTLCHKRQVEQRVGHWLTWYLRVLLALVATLVAAQIYHATIGG